MRQKTLGELLFTREGKKAPVLSPGPNYLQGARIIPVSSYPQLKLSQRIFFKN
jgi:hypothetical protein